MWTMKTVAGTFFVEVIEDKDAVRTIQYHVMPSKAMIISDLKAGQGKL